MEELNSMVIFTGTNIKSGKKWYSLLKTEIILGFVKQVSCFLFENEFNALVSAGVKVIQK